MGAWREQGGLVSEFMWGITGKCCHINFGSNSDKSDLTFKDSTKIEKLCGLQSYDRQ